MLEGSVDEGRIEDDNDARVSGVVDDKDSSEDDADGEMLAIGVDETPSGEDNDVNVGVRVALEDDCIESDGLGVDDVGSGDDDIDDDRLGVGDTDSEEDEETTDSEEAGGGDGQLSGTRLTSSSHIFEIEAPWKHFIFRVTRPMGLVTFSAEIPTPSLVYVVSTCSSFVRYSLFHATSVTQLFGNSDTAQNSTWYEVPEMTETS